MVVKKTIRGYVDLKSIPYGESWVEIDGEDIWNYFEEYDGKEVEVIIIPKDYNA